MTEQMARSLAKVLGGDTERAMPQSHRWGVLATCPNGRFVAIEDGAGWAYRDRAAYVASQIEGDHLGLLDSQEWDDWDGGEEWGAGSRRCWARRNTGIPAAGSGWSFTTAPMAGSR